jgi:hypothetical protein
MGTGDRTYDRRFVALVVLRVASRSYAQQILEQVELLLLAYVGGLAQYQRSAGRVNPSP